VARQRSLNLTATMQLRLTVEYAGDPPDGAIFNGQLEPLERTPDDANQVVDETHGVATADFPLAPIGFRTPNLFLTAQQPAQSDSQLVSVLSPDADAVLPYATAVEALAPMFHDWFAPAPLTPLLLLDHPGSPFEDHAFIVGHLSANAPPEGIESELVRGLTHAFFRAPAPTSLWLDQGLPEFMSLLWTEGTSGRDAAIRQLEQNALTLANAADQRQQRRLCAVEGWSRAVAAARAAWAGSLPARPHQLSSGADALAWARQGPKGVRTLN
jgi:hypothetical protein